MIIVDETLPIGELPPPFPAKNVEVKFDEDIRDSYELRKEIGRGRFGTVYLCNCKKNGLNFAAKFVNTKRNQDRENVEREIEIMKCLNPHPKLIQLYDAYDMGKEMCLILEVVQGGELFERVIDDDFILTERACAIFIQQIVEGVEFIHSKNILHLDMKPENILCMSRQGNRIKICDFGLARKYDPRKKLQVLFGTPEFVAPEVVNFEPIGFGTDMWSIGVICYVLLSGLSPFMGHNYVETMTNVTHNKYDFDDDVFDDVSDDVKDFIEHLLLLDKCERLTPDQCLRHEWFKTALSLEPRSKKNTKVEASGGRGSLVPDSIDSSDTESSSSSSCESPSKSEEVIVVGGKLDLKLNDGTHEAVGQATVNEVIVNIVSEKKPKTISTPMIDSKLSNPVSTENESKIQETSKNFELKPNEPSITGGEPKITEPLNSPENIVHQKSDDEKMLNQCKPSEMEPKEESSIDELSGFKSDSGIADAKILYENLSSAASKVNDDISIKNDNLSKVDSIERAEAIEQPSQLKSQKSIDDAKSLYDSIFNSASLPDIKPKIVSTKENPDKGKAIPIGAVNPSENVNLTKLVEKITNKRFPSDIPVLKRSTSATKYSEKDTSSIVEELSATVYSQENIASTKSLYESLFSSSTKEGSNSAKLSAADGETEPDYPIPKETELPSTSIAVSVEDAKKENNDVKMGKAEAKKVKEGKLKRKERDFTEELELTKKHLKDFVERWNSHPNSPYAIIGSPKLPSTLSRLATENMQSRSSFASIDVVPPSEVDLSDLEDDILPMEEFSCYKITHSLMPGPLPPEKIARELEHRLFMLQREESPSKASFEEVMSPAATTNSFATTKELPNEPLKHPEVVALKREASLKSQTKKSYDALKKEKDILKKEKDVLKKEKDVLKRSDNVKLRPSRDVNVISDKKDKKSRSTTPECCLSPLSTPNKRSRRTSREEYPSSRESESRMTPVKTRRRPSRDVPLSTSQIEVLNSFSGPHKERCTTMELWPDMICMANDDSDSTESDYQPITGKLELPMTASSIQASQDNSKSLKKAKSLDNKDNAKETKTVTWILDMETPAQLPFVNALVKGIPKDDATRTEKKNSDSSVQGDKTELASASLTENNLTTGRLSRRPSSSSINSTSSIDGLTIHTPWGPMRRSPSRSSLKSSDNATIINIKDCFINITKSPNNQKKIEAGLCPLLNRSVGLEYETSCEDKRSKFSERSHKLSEKNDAIEVNDIRNQEPHEVLQSRTNLTDSKLKSSDDSTSLTKLATSIKHTSSPIAIEVIVNDNQSVLSEKQNYDMTFPIEYANPTLTSTGDNKSLNISITNKESINSKSKSNEDPKPAKNVAILNINKQEETTLKSSNHMNSTTTPCRIKSNTINDSKTESKKDINYNDQIDEIKSSAMTTNNSSNARLTEDFKKKTTISKKEENNNNLPDESLKIKNDERINQFAKEEDIKLSVRTKENNPEESIKHKTTIKESLDKSLDMKEGAIPRRRRSRETTETSNEIDHKPTLRQARSNNVDYNDANYAKPSRSRERKSEIIVISNEFSSERPVRHRSSNAESNSKIKETNEDLPHRSRVRNIEPNKGVDTGTLIRNQDVKNKLNGNEKEISDINSSTTTTRLRAQVQNEFIKKISDDATMVMTSRSREANSEPKSKTQEVTKEQTPRRSRESRELIKENTSQSTDLNVRRSRALQEKHNEVKKVETKETRNELPIPVETTNSNTKLTHKEEVIINSRERRRATNKGLEIQQVEPTAQSVVNKDNTQVRQRGVSSGDPTVSTGTGSNEKSWDKNSLLKQLIDCPQETDLRGVTRKRSREVNNITPGHSEYPKERGKKDNSIIGKHSDEIIKINGKIMVDENENINNEFQEPLAKISDEMETSQCFPKTLKIEAQSEGDRLKISTSNLRPKVNESLVGKRTTSLKDIGTTSTHLTDGKRLSSTPNTSRTTENNIQRPKSFHEILIPITKEVDVISKKSFKDINIPIIYEDTSGTLTRQRKIGVDDRTRERMVDIPIQDEKKLLGSRGSWGSSENIKSINESTSNDSRPPSITAENTTFSSKRNSANCKSSPSSLPKSKSPSPSPNSRTINSLQDVPEGTRVKSWLTPSASLTCLTAHNLDVPLKSPDRDKVSPFRSDSKRNSLIDSDDSNSLRRSKVGLPPVCKRPIGLFSAQDRISLFEQKTDDIVGKAVPKPIRRSRSSTIFSDPSTTYSDPSSTIFSNSSSSLDIRSKFNRSSLCERSKLSPTVVCTRV